MMDVALFEPEIPQNTGSVARMCAATGVGLHLAGGLGFALDDKYLKRAGLDYWQDVCMGVHRDLPTLLAALAPRPIYFLSKKAGRLYSDVTYGGNEVFVFGSESVGLPEEILEAHGERALRIPVRGVVRSLNLAAAVHIVIYHALAQLGFPGVPEGLSNGRHP